MVHLLERIHKKSRKMQTVTNGTYFQSYLSYYMESNKFSLFLQTVFMPFYKRDIKC